MRAAAEGRTRPNCQLAPRRQVTERAGIAACGRQQLRRAPARARTRTPHTLSVWQHVQRCRRNSATRGWPAFTRPQRQKLADERGQGPVAPVVVRTECFIEPTVHQLRRCCVGTSCGLLCGQVLSLSSREHAARAETSDDAAVHWHTATRLLYARAVVASFVASCGSVRCFSCIATASAASSDPAPTPAFAGRVNKMDAELAKARGLTLTHGARSCTAGEEAGSTKSAPVRGSAATLPTAPPKAAFADSLARPPARPRVAVVTAGRRRSAGGLADGRRHGDGHAQAAQARRLPWLTPLAPRRRSVAARTKRSRTTRALKTPREQTTPVTARSP